jgi:hypothetical protein
MNNRAILILVFATLETLHETPAGCPASTVTLALANKVPHTAAIEILNLCVDQGLIHRTPAHWVTITTKGSELVKEAQQAIRSAQTQKN